LHDFVALLQVVISYLRRSDYARYLATEEKRRESIARRERVVLAGFEGLLGDDEVPKRIRDKIERLHAAYRDEREYTDVRLERTEDLAGVGLSVEAASHDIVATANQALKSARSADDHVHAWHPEDEVLIHYTGSVVEGLSFVSSRLEDVQGLFVSTRKGKRQLVPADFVSRVYRMYAGMMRQQAIELQLDRGKTELRVRTTDAALLQVMVNLFDNAIYWLTTARTKDPVIHVVIDAAGQRLIFADNGPGVRPEDEPFIFEPFFSGKGTSGKGLGLYIAREVSVRNGFTIDLITDEHHKIERGANILVVFNEATSG
jgi:signal transduction histidine kinase